MNLLIQNTKMESRPSTRSMIAHQHGSMKTQLIVLMLKMESLVQEQLTEKILMLGWII